MRGSTWLVFQDNTLIRYVRRMRVTGAFGFSWALVFLPLTFSLGCHALPYAGCLDPPFAFCLYVAVVKLHEIQVGNLFLVTIKLFLLHKFLVKFWSPMHWAVTFHLQTKHMLQLRSLVTAYDIQFLKDDIWFFIAWAYLVVSNSSLAQLVSKHPVLQPIQVTLWTERIVAPP